MSISLLMKILEKDIHIPFVQVFVTESRLNFFIKL